VLFEKAEMSKDGALLNSYDHFYIDPGQMVKKKEGLIIFDGTRKSPNIFKPTEYTTFRAPQAVYSF